MPSPYIGRFAPSPTGALHQGSLVAALASWLDARAHQGTWLVRIEDIDTPRCSGAAADEILRQLHSFDLAPDTEVLYQSRRTARYQQVLDDLLLRRLTYPCACTRAQIIAHLKQSGQPHQRHSALVYPGTCRPEHGFISDETKAKAWRFHLPPHAQCHITWQDRRLGFQQQQVDSDVGDFVLKRADGIWAYQLAVIVDDMDQHITDIVRGEDLADNTPRQLLLLNALRHSRPRYLHTPLVRMSNGEKLSKQHGAPAVSTSNPLRALNAAASILGLPTSNAKSTQEALRAWVAAWAALYPS